MKMTPPKVASTPSKIMKSRKKPHTSIVNENRKTFKENKKTFNENKKNLIRNYFSPVNKVGANVEDIKLPQDSTLKLDSVPSTPKLGQVLVSYLNLNETKNGDKKVAMSALPSRTHPLGEQQTKQNGTKTNQPKSSIKIDKKL